jgi:tetratricopeptide (TPR) repeat protein
MATRSKSKDSAAKPQQPAKPLKMPFSATGNRVAAETAPAAALSSAEVWDIYQAALQAQRRGDLDAAREGYIKVLAVQPEDFDVLHMLGVLETQRKNLPEALERLNQALKLDPDNPAVHNNLGVALCGLGRHAEGLAEMQLALKLDPDFADACCNIGRALCDSGKAPESLPYFERAVALEPDISEMQFQRATVLDRLQHRDTAMAAYERVVELNPGHADAFCKRGHLLSHAKRFKESLVCYERAIAANPQHAEAHCNRGNVLRLLGHPQEALISVDRAIALQPEIAPAHRIRGVVLMGLGRYDEALACFDRALKLQPQYAEAINDRGNTLRMLGRYEEALREQERSIVISPQAAGTYANRAVVLMDLGRPEEALRDLNRALELAPQNAEFWNLHGNALQALNRHAESVESYTRSMQLYPGYGQPEFNISMCALVRGEFSRGWPMYEARWRTGQKLGWIKFRRPQWKGESFNGRLVIWGEQGIGDQIFHLGMLDSLLNRVNHQQTTLAVTPRLLPLVQRSFPGISFVPLAQATRVPCDLQIPLGSIGGLVRRSWYDFPAQRKAYLIADEERVQALRTRLRQGGKNMVIGLSWLSRAEHFGQLKSIRLQDMESLLRLPGVKFVDLQYGDTQKERDALRQRTGIEVQRLPDVDTFNDMDGLAALIRACDLVVTTSNTTAHLAGAVGASTLLMLPFASGRHWYWHEERKDSPWYPSMQLFRQGEVGDWGDIIEQVRDAVLSRMIGAS